MRRVSFIEMAIEPKVMRQMSWAVALVRLKLRWVEQALAVPADEDRSVVHPKVALQTNNLGQIVDVSLNIPAGECP